MRIVFEDRGYVFGYKLKHVKNEILSEITVIDGPFSNYVVTGGMKPVLKDFKERVNDFLGQEFDPYYKVKALTLTGMKEIFSMVLFQLKS